MEFARRFEDLDVWRKGCQLASEVFKLADDGKLGRNFILRDQICSSALSVPSNVAEGFERDSRKAFISFLKIAKGSSGELRTQIYIAAKRGYLERKKAMELVANAKEISRMLSGLAQSLKAESK